MAQKNIRIDDHIVKDIESIAETNHTTFTQTVHEALKLYRDFHYTQNKATFLNDEILAIINAKNKQLESNINFKTNKLLSELAIQSAVTNMILCKSLEISSKEVNAYRLKALDFLKENNRILNLSEILEHD